MYVNTFGAEKMIAPNASKRQRSAEHGGWPRLLISLASPRKRGAPPFAFFGEGRESEMPAGAGPSLPVLV